MGCRGELGEEDSAGAQGQQSTNRRRCVLLRGVPLANRSFRLFVHKNVPATNNHFISKKRAPQAFSRAAGAFASKASASVDATGRNVVLGAGSRFNLGKHPLTARSAHQDESLQKLAAASSVPPRYKTPSSAVCLSPAACLSSAAAGSWRAATLTCCARRQRKPSRCRPSASAAPGLTVRVLPGAPRATLPCATERLAAHHRDAQCLNSSPALPLAAIIDPRRKVVGISVAPIQTPWPSVQAWPVWTEASRKNLVPTINARWCAAAPALVSTAHSPPDDDWTSTGR